MALYDYECECGEIFDVFQMMNDPKIKTCGELKKYWNSKKNIKDGFLCECKDDAKIKRLLSVPTIQVIERGTMTDRKLYKELDE